MVWGCLAASHPGWLAIKDGPINYVQILQENVSVSVCEVKLNDNWIMQQDSNPKNVKSRPSPNRDVVEDQKSSLFHCFWLIILIRYILLRLSWRSHPGILGMVMQQK